MTDCPNREAQNMALLCWSLKRQTRPTRAHGVDKKKSDVFEDAVCGGCKSQMRNEQWQEQTCSFSVGDEEKHGSSGWRFLYPLNDKNS